MATHFSTLAWKIPWTEEPGGLLSMGSHRVGHDWSNLAAAAAVALVFIVSSPHNGEGNGTPLQYFAWKIPWTEEPGGLQFVGLLRVRHNWATSLSLFTFMHWRRKWQPTHCSCLENPRDGGAWWAAVHGVAQSRTRLKQLSNSSSSSNPHNGPASLRFFSPFYRHLSWAPEDLRSFNKLKK